MGHRTNEEKLAEMERNADIEAELAREKLKEADHTEGRDKPE